MNISDTARVDLARALVATGMILYVPSNVMPVMTMTIVGAVEPLTVLGGVHELYESGLPLVAGVVFLASFVVPFLKLASLGWILFLHGKPQMQRQRSTLHQIVHKIGSWSMVDIFLLSVLAAVGQLGALAGVTAKPGAIFFATVLICCIFAVEIYKPRLIWETQSQVIQSQ
jgi:paraquat-inducible protein A